MARSPCRNIILTRFTGYVVDGFHGGNFVAANLPSRITMMSRVLTVKDQRGFGVYDA